MEENRLFNQIKSAAENAETKDYPGMENVWQRVENKLDTKEDKKAIGRWKKLAVAASILLFGTLGYQFFTNNSESITPKKAVTIVTDSIQKPIIETSAVVTAEPTSETLKKPLIKKEAEQILKHQITRDNQVAMEESVKFDEDDALVSKITTEQRGYFSAPATATNESVLNTSFVSKLKKEKDVELFFNKSAKVSNSQKEEPLLIIGDKVSKQEIRKVEFTETDSLIVLNEPLYIINGEEFTEQQVFGPNPTSPYTPLNKQEIETLSILQHEKAFEIYGNKGKKGVVIITTKNGKPVSASKKAK
ncbi:hypothetical protein [Flavobacterium sp. 25HG05S-40]|uniref:hypothetical protein n=1 Tax=Flavobacterium sp. 25HG05S-40 TaxID=3458682 RepID=UPI004044CE63